MLINEPEIAQHAIKVVPKTWGVEFWLVNTENYCLKFLKIIPGYQSSIHCHKKKDETFLGYFGTVQLNIHADDGSVHKVHAIHPGERYQIMPKVYHSFQAHNVAWILEVSTHHDDRDVFRLQESRKLDGQG